MYKYNLLRKYGDILISLHKSRYKIKCWVTNTMVGFNWIKTKKVKSFARGKAKLNSKGGKDTSQNTRINFDICNLLHYNWLSKKQYDGHFMKRLKTRISYAKTLSRTRIIKGFSKIKRFKLVFLINLKKLSL